MNGMGIRHVEGIVNMGGWYGFMGVRSMISKINLI